MLILHIETGKHFYGGPLQVDYLLKGLKEKNCRNILVCTEGSPLANFARPHAEVHELPFNGDLDLRFPLRLRKIILAESPDIIHIHSRKGDLWGTVAAWLTKRPAVLTRRVDNPESTWVVHLKYDYLKRIIAISKEIRRVLVTEGVSEHKIDHVPSGVDSGAFCKDHDKQWLHSEFNIKPGHKVVGMVAQFIPRKGHRYLIEAAPHILEQCPDTCFLFLGQGRNMEELQALCHKVGIAHKTKFAGFRPDLERILPCIDLIVHPATMEGLGVSLLQAAAAAVPIVATNVGGIPEIVHNGMNGYLVEPGDSLMIAQRVNELLQDADKAHRFGVAGQSIVASNFTVEAMVSGNLKVYHEVLKEEQF